MLAGGMILGVGGVAVRGLLRGVHSLNQLRSPKYGLVVKDSENANLFSLRSRETLVWAAEKGLVNQE